MYLSFCRILGYLSYLISLPPNHLASAAYLDSLLLAQAGQPGWFSDLRFVMRWLPVPVTFPSRGMAVTEDTIAEARTGLELACAKWPGDIVVGMPSRLPLIQRRPERDEHGEFVANPLKLRQYLRIPVPAHRKALTRLLLSSHTLGVEILRYAERYRKRAPREFRFCRFCRRGVETEAHAMITCSAPALTALRHPFIQDIYELVPEWPRNWTSSDIFLRTLVQTRNFDVLQRLAKYTFEVFAEYRTQAIFKPAEYLYNAME